MIRNRLTLIIVASCGFWAVHAEEVVDGLDAGRKVAGSAWQFATLKAPEIAAQHVALPDTQPAEPRRTESDSPGLDKIGYVLPFAPTAESAWRWTTRDDGNVVAATQFKSRGACGLRLRFEDLDSRAKIQIRLADEAGQAVYGPFESPTPDDAGGWWSPTIWDEIARVELFSEKALPLDVPAPRVAAVAYINVGGCGAGAGSALSCNNDISCFPSWANNEGRAKSARPRAQPQSENARPQRTRKSDESSPARSEKSARM